MATPTSGAVPVARNEPRTRTALLLEAIALRHQIAVLERSRTAPRLPSYRSAVLALAVALVAAMARKPADRSARDRLTLAP
jgi:hypothetical protein